MKHSTSICAFAVVLTLSASAHATLLSNGSGLGSTHQTITFDEFVLDANDPVTTLFSGSGVTFASAYGNPDTLPYANMSGNRIGNFQSGRTQDGLFTMTFANALTQIAFAYVSAPGTSTLQAFLGSTLVESEQVSTSANNPANFLGFTDILFDRVTITVQSQDHAMLLDNLQTVASVTAVPEPSTWALFVAGLTGMGALRLRGSRTAERAGRAEPA